MPNQENPYRILCGVDFSETSELALERAIELARNESAELHAVVVVDDTPAGVPMTRTATLTDLVEESHDGLVSLLQRMAQEKNGMPGAVKTFAHVRVGYPAEEIVQLAADIGADLVVVGTHGRRGIKRLVMGSVAERVLRLSHCPVLVVRPKDYKLSGTPLEPEPPCPECVKTRNATGGKEWWCDDHKSNRELPHRYSYSTLITFAEPPGHVW